MILQRLASALKRQDWFQVVVEIMIVVIGIFLGLQVDDWNTEREERAQEQIYLNRMHSEVIDAIDFREQSFEGVIRSSDTIKFNRNLRELLAVFDGRDTETVLGPLHCFAIMGSHIYNDQSVDIPTLRELNASGRLTLIQSEEIKLAISRFAFGMEGMGTLVGTLTGSALVMPRKYPDLITLDLKMHDIQASDQFSHDCDFERMRNDKAFLNDLVDNASRMNAFASLTTQIGEFMETLHQVLDQEIGIVHEESAP